VRRSGIPDAKVTGMTERFRARLVNEPFGDPALYVEFAFERRALLFDVGTLEPTVGSPPLPVPAINTSRPRGAS
jgi:hypothetical protein